MPRCSDCRGQQAELNLWEKVRACAFRFFHENITDLSSDKFTQGFGEGYKQGFEHANTQKGILSSLQRVESVLTQINRPQTKADFDSVDTSQVLVAIKQGQNVILQLNGETLLPDKVDMLRQEAVVLLRSDLWRILQETVKNDAVNNFLVKGENWEEVLKGRAMLRNLDLQKRMVDAIIEAT